MRKVNIKSPGTFLGVLKLYIYIRSIIWGEIFKNGPSKNCGRQPLKNLQ